MPTLTNFLRNEILIDEGDPCLPEKALVFSGRRYEQFMFFDANGLVEEPPITYYMECKEEFTEKGKSVFDILEDEIEFARQPVARGTRVEGTVEGAIAVKNHR